MKGEKLMPDDTETLLEKLQDARQNRAAEARAAALQTALAAPAASAPSSDAAKSILNMYERPDAGGKEGAIHDTDNRIRDAK